MADRLSELVFKSLNLGLGILWMSSEKITETFARLSEEFGAASGDRRGLVASLADEVETARMNVRKQIGDSASSILHDLHLPSREDLARIEDRIDDMEKALREDRAKRRSSEKPA